MERGARVSAPLFLFGRGVNNDYFRGEYIQHPLNK